MTTSTFAGSEQTFDNGQSPIRAAGEGSENEVGEESGEVSGPAAEFDPEITEAHAEASNEGEEGVGEIQVASPEALAAEESAESAASDLVAEGEPLSEGGAETGPEESAELLHEVGSALDGGAEFAFLGLLAAKLVPMLVSTAGPGLARAIMGKLSPRAKRLLAKARPGAGMASVLQKLMAQALKRPESGEEAAAVDEAMALEMTAAMEVIIGTDDRLRIKNTVKVPWRRYCALRIEFPNGSTYRGTGFFIGDRVLATAGHCVYMRSEGGWARRIEVIPACNGNQRPFGSVYATSFKSTTGWVKNKTEAADYGAIILPSNAFPGQRFGRFALRAFATNTLLAVPAVVAGYPGDKPFAELWGMKRKIKKATSLQLIYDIDTVGGQSGAPVYIKQGGKRYAVGIHNYGKSSGNSATRITPAVIANFKKWGAIGAIPSAPPPSAPAVGVGSKVAQAAPQPALASAGLSADELDM